MNLTIKGKNMDVPENAKAYIQKKIGRLDRHLNNITEAKVELSEEKTRSKENRYVVEVTLDCQGTLLRGEERAADVLTAIDNAHDIMNRQIRRYKDRLDARKKHRLSLGEALAVRSEQPESIVRVKRFLIKPMSIEEAIDQMELLGHDFFVFFNENDDRLNVLYRRKGSSYGLLEPESA
jgi:putative sigma-54 modulation protein